MKFRASFSVLDKWSKGDWQGAVEAYFKLREFTSRAMEQGKEIHEKWEKEINKTGCLPKLFGGKKLGKKPIIEQKFVVPVFEWMELVFIPDLVDGDCLHDFKTGKTPSSHYLKSMQFPVYALGLSLADIQVDRAFIHHYNQHDKTTDFSIMWLSIDSIKEALEWLETYGSEMHSYLEENKLYERFKK